MAESTTGAARCPGVVGRGSGCTGGGLTAVIAQQFDPAVLRDYRLVLFSLRGTGAGAWHCPQL